MVLCPCGRPLHYSDPAKERMVSALVAELGQTIPITVPGIGTYAVPRHYIALHGIKGSELAAVAERYGFRKVE